MSDTSEKVEAVTAYSNDAPLRANTKHTVELAKLNRDYTRLYDEYDQLGYQSHYKEKEIRRNETRQHELLKQIGAIREAILELMKAQP